MSSRICLHGRRRIAYTLRYSLFWQRFEPYVSRIQVRSVTGWTQLLCSRSCQVNNTSFVIVIIIIDINFINYNYSVVLMLILMLLSDESHENHLQFLTSPCHGIKLELGKCFKLLIATSWMRMATEVNLHAFLTSALYSEWIASRFSCLALEEITSGTCWIGG